MGNVLDSVLDQIDVEFDGKSWNEKSLMATLRPLSAREAASMETWEGYSAWEIARHCAKCKRIVAADLGAPVPDWPYPAAAWFPSPADTSDGAWARDLSLLAELHEASMKALRGFPESRLDDEMPTWKAPWRKVILWLVTHDSFHGAQVRSMGLPSLKSKKHE